MIILPCAWAADLYSWSEPRLHLDDSFGIFTFSFDDGTEGQFENAYPILAQRGFAATICVIPQHIGKPQRASLAQLHELQEVGWEIASHSYSHRNLTSIDDMNLNLTGEIAGSKEWLTRRGFQVRSFFYPFGGYDNSTEEIRRLHYPVAAAIAPSYRTYSGSDVIDNSLISRTSSDTWPAMKNWINFACGGRTWLTIVIHDVGSGGTMMEIDPNRTAKGEIQNLAEIADYVRERVDRGDLRVMTFSDAWSEMNSRSASADRSCQTHFLQSESSGITPVCRQLITRRENETPTHCPMRFCGV